MSVKEKIGKIVEINGGFIVIDQTEEKDDGKGISKVVQIFPKNIHVRNYEIRDIVLTFASGNGGCLDCGKTHFVFSSIWRSNPTNNGALKNHIDNTKMVVVYNSETKEYFLVMSEDVSIADARNFLFEVNKQEFPNLKGVHEKSKEVYCNSLRLPHESIPKKLHPDGNPRFEVVINSGIAVIQLQVF